MRIAFGGRQQGKTARLRAIQQLIDAGNLYIPRATQEMVDALKVDEPAFQQIKKESFIDVEFRVVKDLPELTNGK